MAAVDSDTHFGDDLVIFGALSINAWGRYKDKASTRRFTERREMPTSKQRSGSVALTRGPGDFSGCPSSSSGSGAVMLAVVPILENLVR